MRQSVLKLVVILVVTLAVPFFLVGGCDNNNGDSNGGGGMDNGGGGEVQIDSNDIGGNVSNSGPEAGVWVIAETMDVATNMGAPSRFIKIVVTDQNGNFVIPDLPNATYDLWVRGYGLADSDPVQAQPGDMVNLQAVEAATPQEAAAIYPANYWAGLIEMPDDSEFTEGSGWNLGSQDQLIDTSKLGCQLCHQLGTQATRLPNAAAFDFGWKKAGTMNGTANGIGRDNWAAVLGDWGSRIAGGEVPPAPPRPSGTERNVVLTMWAWGDTFTYAHDEISTDKRNPNLYPDGPLWGVDIGNDYILKIDPETNEATRIHIPTVGGYDTPWCDATFAPLGGEPGPAGFATLGCPAEGGTTAFPGAYDNPANPHNPMLDDTGKLWFTTQIRREWQADYPDFCMDDPAIMGTPEAPRSHHRQLGYYDTNTDEFVLIDTCFGNHHLAFDDNGILWLSGDSFVVGWFDPSKFDPEDPNTLEEAQGWSAVVVDSDGDQMPDTPIFGFHYGVNPNPVDGSIWYGVLSGFPGRIERYDPATDTHEAYTPPAPGHGPRGVDVDTNGNVWTCLAGSSHLAKFERDKCDHTWGTGDQCPEGWTLYDIPGATYKGLPNKKTDYHYLTWVDQFNTLGLGANTVVCPGTASDSMIAFNPNTEQFTRLYVPYPLGFYSRGLDGRIDDANAGWKGRAWWADYGIDPIIHTELQQGFGVKFQLRPNPLDH